MNGLDVRVKSAEFLTSAVEVAGCPAPDLPEVAFAGRSNVGKSSLINALTRRKKLVRVSNTPGRTRALNFFDARLIDRQGNEHALRLCDLPGYGYAKVSQVERKRWQGLIEGYLTGRKSLRAVVLIVDAEVGPTELDRTMLTWLDAAQRPIVPVATKLDRLGKARRIGALRAVEASMGLPRGSVVGASSAEGLGLDAIWERVLALVASSG